MFFSDEETEAMPAKSVHRSGNQQVTMATLLNKTGRTLSGFSYIVSNEQLRIL